MKKVCLLLFVFIIALPMTSLAHAAISALPPAEGEISVNRVDDGLLNYAGVITFENSNISVQKELAIEKLTPSAEKQATQERQAAKAETRNPWVSILIGGILFSVLFAAYKFWRKH